MLKTSFICPYCFESVRMKEVELRCTNKRCEDVPDLPKTKYLNGNEAMPVQDKTTFPAEVKGGVPGDSGICPKCSNVTHRRVCPRCHNELPESSIDGGDMIISIVGSRASGKSHYVGVLIKELMNRIAPALNGSFEGFADSFSRWDAKYNKNLYVNCRKLELTRSSLTDVDNGAYIPYIFKLKLKKKGFFKDYLNSYTFVFFDTAGEDLNDEMVMNTVNKYICKSAGIIFLLDPMQIPEVANHFDESYVRRATGAVRQQSGADQIITRVSDLIRADRGMHSGIIDIPVAAVFSKFDAISSLVPKECIVQRPSPHCALRAFDAADCRNVNDEINSLLEEWNATAFTSQLATNYKNYCYFAASALGIDNNPDENGRIKKPRPHRIEDPMLWIMKERGIIKAGK